MMMNFKLFGESFTMTNKDFVNLMMELCKSVGNDKWNEFLENNFELVSVEQ